MYVPVYQSLSPIDSIRRAHAGDGGFPFNAPHHQYFYRARNAIFHLFNAMRSMRGRVVVLAPEYNSGNEVLAMQAAGATIRYCPIGHDLRMDPVEVERLCERHRPDVLYVIHYAGWPQPMPELVELCRRRNMWLVEDCALALLSSIDGRPLGSFGNWSVFCLYKTLPVPNGAVLVQNGPVLDELDHVRLRPANTASVAGRMAELLVQRMRTHVDGVGRVLYAVKRGLGRTATALNVHRANVGDIGFDLDDVDLAMSAASEHLLRRLDFPVIRQRRIRNFHRLLAKLDRRVEPLFSDLPKGACPLFFPVLVPNKQAAADALWRHGIEALQFWNDAATIDGCETSATERHLRAHVLELPIHQDLTARQIDYLARHVSNLPYGTNDALDTTYAA